MKKLILLFASLAVIGFSCQKDEVAPLDAASKANVAAASKTVYMPAAGVTENCVDIYDLTADKNKKAGTVSVYNNGSSLLITYTTAVGWTLKETKVYVGSAAELPVNPQGMPVQGHFPNKASYPAGTTTATVVVDLPAGDCAEGVIYAHADMVSPEDKEAGAWGGDQIGVTNGWHYFIKDYCQRVCESVCTRTQGYWKNHGPEGCASGNNSNMWPVSSLTLGNVAYTDLQLCTIFNMSTKGNGLVSLAHQLIAAKLNVANGADASAISTAIANADAMIGSLNVITGGHLANGVTSALTTELDNYNMGITGPGHCE